MKLVNEIVKVFNNKYYAGPILLTVITSIIFLYPYNSSGNFDLTITFYSFISIISTALMILFLHYTIKGMKDFIPLFNMSFLCLVLSILSIMLSKTLSFINAFAFPMMIVTTLLFFVILKEVINKIEAYH